MLTGHVSSVIKQALATFAGKTEIFHQNLELLKVLLDKTTAADVNLHPQFLTDTLWQRKNKAPVTFIDIYEDSNITMGIFVLKPGMKLPLHNHPGMHGLIKVVAGTVKITSYSLNTDKVRELNTQSSSNLIRPILTVERTPECYADTHAACCVLEPEKRNIHEIESVGGAPAAFIDILAPPYSHAANGPRQCSYYQVLRELAPNVFRLQETAVPSWYWSDSFPYTGPEL